MRSVIAMFLSLAALAALSLPALAQDEGEVVRLSIGPDVVECEGVAPQTCLLVATLPDGQPQLFYDRIVGFEHVPGTAYVIDVLVEPVEDPPADASSLRYTLVDTIEEIPGHSGSRAPFTVVPDEAFCGQLTTEIDLCVARLRAVAMLGVVPESYAELMTTAD